MKNDFIPFSMPDIGEAEINEVVNCLRSGWITTGPKAKEFEEKFTEFLGVEGLHSLAVNSATSGLHLALEAIGVGPGDEVIVPTYTFTATAEVVRYLGAKPVFVDINEATLNVTADDIAPAISSKTKAIVPVHFAGRACDMGPIIELARKHGVMVVEDAAHALPSTYKGEMIGTLDSDATVFSFYANKTMTTGEGGMLVTRRQEIADRCRVMRLHGINRDAFDRYTSKKPSWFYEVVAPGFKYNMPDISAALGIQQLKRLRQFQKKRQELAEIYNNLLADLPLTLPDPLPANDIHAWHLYVIRIDKNEKVDRNKFIEEMAAKGVGCSVHFIPLHLHPYWRDSYNLTPNMFPVSQRVFEEEVTLPLYTKMTKADVVKVVRAIKQVLLYV